MKNIFFLLLLYFVFHCSFAQEYSIQESASFEEPTEGFLRLIQLENGHTAFMHFETAIDMKLRVYDQTRKMILNKSIELPFTSEGGESRKGGKYMLPPEIFSVGNDLVMFSGTYVDGKHALNRLIYDGTTGMLKDEEILAALEGVTKSKTYGSYFGHAFGGVPPPTFFLRKDPVSEHYVIGVLNSHHPDRENKGIEIIHFSNAHEEIGRAYYQSPNPEFKFLEIIDVALVQDQKLVAVAYVFDKRGHEHNYNVIFSLEKGASKIEIKKFNHPKVDRFNVGILQNNTISGVLAFMGLNRDSKKDNVYSAHFTIFDPMSLEVLFLKDLSTPNVQAEYKEMFGEREEFQGLPQDFSIDEEGNYMIIFEEMTVQTSGYNTITRLEHGAVAVLDDKTVEKEQYIIPKSHLLPGSPLDNYGPMYLSDKNYKPKNMFQSNLYKTITYINSVNGRYIFFNDVAKNIEKIEKGKNKLTTINGVGDCNAYVIKLENGETHRSLLFEEEDKTNKLGLFRVYDYDPATSTLVTLKLNIGKDKLSRVVWIKL